MLRLSSPALLTYGQPLHSSYRIPYTATSDYRADSIRFF
jgi:hypothetical protein